TNSDDGSFGRQVMSTGSCSPDTNGSIDRRGGVCPLAWPRGVAPVGAALDGMAADGGAETPPVGEAEGPGVAADDGEGVGVLQHTRVPATRRARKGTQLAPSR